MSQSESPVEPARNPAAIVGAILLTIGLAAALSVDVVRTGYGIKGDEATYVAMSTSLAYDHDLSYEQRDLERFSGLYRAGPEGLFLKRGKQLRIRFRGSPPYLRISKAQDPRDDRAYFGKAFIYPLAAAPFVRFLGLNGFLVFHVLLLYGVCVCGYTFLAVRSRPGPALAFTLAFVGATVVPVYAVFLTSDVFNFAIVFFAYFLWLYKQVAPPEGSRFLRGLGSDVCAALLLGAATFSKPTNALLAVPLVLLLWWNRRFLAGMLVGAVFVGATLGLFGINALDSGEFNYQGGDRKTFYGTFPFDAPNGTWESRGIPMATNDADTEVVLAPVELVNRFGLNVEYFLVGRHFGFIPYFFPGFIAICLWLGSAERTRSWRILTFGAVLLSTVVLLLFAPYSWSGGGGPSGNRYFLGLYPALFFLTPPLTSMTPVMVIWIGGALFTAKMLVNPFATAKFPYLATERGPARRLPVELTMANDLPVRLDDPRSHVLYLRDPLVLLYFLDQNAFPPEPAGIWISGAGRADILARTEVPLDHLSVTAASPIRTVFTMSAGRSTQTVILQPEKPVTFDLPVSSVRGLESYAFLISARSTEGFTPHLRDPKSTDYRNLGVIVQFKAFEAPR